MFFIETLRDRDIGHKSQFADNFLLASVKKFVICLSARFCSLFLIPRRNWIDFQRTANMYLVAAASYNHVSHVQYTILLIEYFLAHLVFGHYKEERVYSVNPNRPILAHDNDLSISTLHAVFCEWNKIRAMLLVVTNKI